MTVNLLNICRYSCAATGERLPSYMGDDDFKAVSALERALDSESDRLGQVNFVTS